MKESLVVEADGEEHRVYNRRAVLWTGKLQYGDYVFDCQVWNVSLGGARVKIGLPLDPGAEVVLMLERFGNFHGKVCWRSGGTHGIKFDHAPELIASALGHSTQRLGLSGVESNSLA